MKFSAFFLQADQKVALDIAQIQRHWPHRFSP